MRALGWIALTALALVAWTAAGLPVADWLAARGAFGTCFEGACGYAAIFLFLPLWAVGGTAATVLAVWWWRRRRGR